MYWQLIPNADPHEEYVTCPFYHKGSSNNRIFSWDYEIGMDNDGWSDFVTASQAAITKSSPWDWSPYLL